MPKITNYRQLFDEAHEIFAWLFVLIGIALLVAKAAGYATLDSWHIVVVLAFGPLVALYGKAKRIKAGPGGIDIERGD